MTGDLLHVSHCYLQVDAFIQRCHDLLEVVDGQEHFSRYSNGVKKPIPLFSGCKGPKIARSLKEIEHTFEKLLANLEAVQV